MNGADCRVAAKVAYSEMSRLGSATGSLAVGWLVGKSDSGVILGGKVGS